MMRTFIHVFALATALGLAGCHRGEPAEAPPAVGSEAPSSGMAATSDGGARKVPECPMGIANTQATYEALKNGAAIVFTNPDATRVGQVRARVHAMADFHNAHCRNAGSPACCRGWGHGPRGPGRGPGQGPGPGAGRGMGLGPMPPSTATAVDVPGGARFEIRAQDPSQAPLVQQHLQHHTQMMESGQCPFMKRGPTGPGAGPGPSNP